MGEARRIQSKQGFTLVELLVVIGIIGLLISILLPTLSKAKASAERTACLSNLRQLHHSFLIYANDNDGRAPIGYRRGKQFNSMVYSATAGRYVMFGILYEAKLLREPGILYCPSENNVRFAQGTAENPWPPGPDGDATKNVQSGYGLRPVVDLPDNLAAAPATFAMPKLASFMSQAIASDLTSSVVRVDTRHRTGVNVLFGDGSARWVSRDAIEPWISLLPEPSFPPDPQWNDEVDAIWDSLDRQ